MLATFLMPKLDNVKDAPKMSGLMQLTICVLLANLRIFLARPEFAQWITIKILLLAMFAKMDIILTYKFPHAALARILFHLLVI